MGRKCTSNDVDLMQPDLYIVPKNRWAKTPPLEPWQLPDFEVHFAKTLIECTGSNWLVSYCADINSVRDKTAASWQLAALVVRFGGKLKLLVEVEDI